MATLWRGRLARAFAVARLLEERMRDEDKESYELQVYAHETEQGLALVHGTHNYNHIVFYEAVKSGNLVVCLKSLDMFSDAPSVVAEMRPNENFNGLSRVRKGSPEEQAAECILKLLQSRHIL